MELEPGLVANSAVNVRSAWNIALLSYRFFMVAIRSTLMMENCKPAPGSLEDYKTCKWSVWARVGRAVSGLTLLSGIFLKSGSLWLFSNVSDRKTATILLGFTLIDVYSLWRILTTSCAMLVRFNNNRPPVTLAKLNNILKKNEFVYLAT